MKTRVGYIYDRKVMNARSRHYTPVFDPTFGKILEIWVTTLDDNNNVVSRHCYSVKEEDVDVKEVHKMTEDEFFETWTTCPFCKGNETIALYAYPTGYSFACADCMVMTPRAPTFEKALEYWDALLMVKEAQECDKKNG